MFFVRALYFYSASGVINIIVIQYGLFFITAPYCRGLAGSGEQPEYPARKLDTDIRHKTRVIKAAQADRELKKKQQADHT